LVAKKGRQEKKWKSRGGNGEKRGIHSRNLPISGDEYQSVSDVSFNCLSGKKRASADQKNKTKGTPAHEKTVRTPYERWGGWAGSHRVGSMV